MRARLFRWLLGCLRKKMPSWAAVIEIQILLNITARAFSVPGKRVWRLPAQEALREYAAFTVKGMESFAGDPRQIWQEAYRAGSLIRTVTGFTDSRDRELLIFYLYRNLQIVMNGRIPGEIVVTECYFSRYYTREQCALMSCVDSGIMAGINGGGELVFTGRITEGCGRCTAQMR